MVNKLPSYASRKCIIYKYLLGGFLKIELDNKFQEFLCFFYFYLDHQYQKCNWKCKSRDWRKLCLKIALFGGNALCKVIYKTFCHIKWNGKLRQKFLENGKFWLKAAGGFSVSIINQYSITVLNSLILLTQLTKWEAHCKQNIVRFI